jgi:hypothetical protein
MSTFDHANLMQGINECLTPFRKSQSEAMQGFGQLAPLWPKAQSTAKTKS